MKQLPVETVRLLSSCQVITSVVNVVKELVENSLDAGASSIEVKLENYGLDRIEVRDNGSGIKATDTPVMAVKHYTSKISCHQDLEQLETYGFRGEALGSICAVSEVVLTTKTADDAVGTQYTLDLNGRIVSQKPSHLGQGTTVVALKLFKNLPVRRQFYSTNKKCKDELKKVQDLLMAYAIVKPELRVLLTHNRAAVWQKARVSDRRTALMAVLGTGLSGSMLPLQYRQEQPEITIDGYFPKPGSDYTIISSCNSDKTFIFVNKRPVHHKDILKLIRQRYSTQCGGETAQTRYPTAMVNITIPASTVDVNLTPDKTQVMLTNKDAVLLAMETMLMSLYDPQPATEPVAIPGEGEKVSPDVSNWPLLVDAGTGTDLAGVVMTRSTSLPRDSTTSNKVAPLSGLNPSSGTLGEPADGPSPNQTANTSSSSCSEDWIVNTSACDFDASFSLIDENAVLNSTRVVDRDPAQSSDSAQSRQKDDVLQISAESWSRGRALLDPVTAEPLEPVKIHLSAERRGLGETDPKAKKDPCQKISNAVAEKEARLTAYELISNQVVRRPLSASALFEQETRPAILQENPKARLQDVTIALEERWENLRMEDRKKFEKKAERDLDRYNLQTKQALVQSSTSREPGRRTKSAQKRKAPLSNQLVLDQLLSQPQRKRSPANCCRPSRPLPFSLAALRKRLSPPSHQSGPDPEGLRLVNPLPSHSAWLVLCARKLMLLNPSRVEEALLFKRLLENNILPAATLQTPIQLTDGLLGGAENTSALCKMEKQCPDMSGVAYFSDPRLVANGFKIRLIPGSSSVERRLEVVEMSDCMPFFGVADLREILTAVVKKNATTVKECRPLKVLSYLEGEAVRLVRQLPLNFSREDVRDTLSRMKQQLDEGRQSCLHGRPFFHYLTDVPET